MFGEIEKALDDGAFSVDATYDPELGYPTEYFIDVEELMADEEFGVVVLQLSPS